MDRLITMPPILCTLCRKELMTNIYMLPIQTTAGVKGEKHATNIIRMQKLPIKHHRETKGNGVSV